MKKQNGNRSMPFGKAKESQAQKISEKSGNLKKSFANTLGIPAEGLGVLLS
jgi:hypothetical protein